LLRFALHLFRLHRERSARNNQVVHLTLIKARASLFERNKRERESRDVIAVLEKAALIVKAGDLRRQNKRLGLTTKREVLACARTVVVGLPETFDLDLADGLTDPFGCAWLCGPQKDLRGWLGKHSL
jgi:hypothetical protein